MELSTAAEAAGFQLLHVTRAESTNEAALKAVLAGADRFWVVADEQTAGRGRHGRAWASPPGNLYASLGIPEFWRYNGQEWKIYALQTDRTYQELSQSPTFPTIEKAQLYQFLAASEQDEIAAEAQLRHQLRSSVISDRQ